MIEFAMIAVMFGLQGYALYLLHQLRPVIKASEPTAIESTFDEIAEPKEEPFTVDAKPRSIPWPIRRKELRNAARTRRAKAEEWRNL